MTINMAIKNISDAHKNSVTKQKPTVFECTWPKTDNDTENGA